jgi:hypothetical protein
LNKKALQLGFQMKQLIDLEPIEKYAEKSINELSDVATRTLSTT